MKEKAECELIGLLRHYYGDAWNYQWENDEDGFELTVKVWNWNQEEE